MDDLPKLLNVDPDIFAYVILPLLIFMARIVDVSIATMRIMFVMSGKKVLAPLLGFFEALVWLVAIGQIMQNLTNIYTYIAYALGFAMGTLAGILLEERLALGNVMVRVITRVQAHELLEQLKVRDYRFTNIEGEGREGKVNLIFTVVKRENLPKLIDTIKECNPKAFYTIEAVKKVSEYETSGAYKPLWTRMGLKKGK